VIALSAPSDRASAVGATAPFAADPGDTADIVSTIARLVHDVIGEDVEFDLDITADSSFSEDIELESIEFVALGEQLQLTYGDKIDLVGWFGELDLDEIIDLTVGELAEFIAACLADDGGAGAPGGVAGASPRSTGA
jgi:acyl carrier protein